MRGGAGAARSFRGDDAKWPAQQEGIPSEELGGAGFSFLGFLPTVLTSPRPETQCCSP